MTIYIVERESGDGLEMDCFEDYELAKRWSKVCYGVLSEADTWDEKFTEEMIKTYNQEEV